SEGLLHAAVARGEIAHEEIAGLCAIFDQLPALAWGEVAVGVGESTPLPSRVGPESTQTRARDGSPPTSAREASARRETEAEPNVLVTALVVGSETLAEELVNHREGIVYEVQRAEDGTCAIDLARALAPDIVVVDADRPGARSLCTSLAEDPLMDAVPVVVVGQWAHPDEAAPFVALGAARTLIKPVSPGALRRACAAACAVSSRWDVRGVALGTLSVEELGARLAEELRRGLGDAALAHGRGVHVDLGEGSEVLAPLWGAVARIRDMVTIRSSGQVRFTASGPEGALPIAPWVGDEQVRAAAFGEARTGAVSLEGKVVVVADDDPAVTWFLAGVLRASGALVHEAHDGARALDLAHQITPDLVITDVIMPVLDAFALCRALKRDIVLRDVPVILLSWKEDLLQRVRELDGRADGYLRKEA